MYVFSARPFENHLCERLPCLKIINNNNKKGLRIDRAIKYGQALTWRVRASKNLIFWKIQNKYFYSVPYSNETLYMKALEYYSV
jgi:hypothetical protein